MGFIDRVMNVIKPSPTVDPETLPLVQELREEIERLHKVCDNWEAQWSFEYKMRKTLEDMLKMPAYVILNSSPEEVKEIMRQPLTINSATVLEPMNSFNLNALAKEVYVDAIAHGLYDYPEYKGSAENVRKACVMRIQDELFEAYEAAGDKKHFDEEMADLLLVTLSAAGHCEVDIEEEVMAKKKRNAERSWKHEGERQGVKKCSG